MIKRWLVLALTLFTAANTYAASAIPVIPVKSVAGKKGDVTLNVSDIEGLTTALSSSSKILSGGIISDPHYRDSNPAGIVDIMADINSNFPDIKVMLGGGDIAYNTSIDETYLVEWGVYRKANITTKGILWQSADGNHDSEGPGELSVYMAAWREANGPGSSEFGLYGVSKVFKWNNLVIITLGLEKDSGGLLPSDTALDWLEKQLLQYQGHNVIVVSHYPPIDCGLASSAFDITAPGMASTNSARIKSICAANKIAAWFTGHLHYKADGTPGNILTAVPSGYGGTRFFGMPAAILGDWIYFQAVQGESAILFRFRDSTTGTWFDQNTTLDLTYPIANVHLMNEGHTHENKDNVDLAVAGPVSSIDNALCRFADTTGKALEQSPYTSDANGNLTVEVADTSPRLIITNTNSTASRIPGFSVANYKGNWSGGYPIVGMLNAKGTRTDPIASDQTDRLGELRFSGYDGNVGKSGVVGAWIAAFPEATWTTSSHATRIAFGTSVGTEFPAEKMSLSSAGVLTVSTLKFSGDSSTMSSAVAASGSTGQIQYAGPGGTFASNASAKLDDSGNMSLGTTPPASGRLKIDGDVNITGSFKVNDVPVSGAVTSVFSRTGAVTAADGDYSQSLITGLKNSDSPQFAAVGAGRTPTYQFDAQAAAATMFRAINTAASSTTGGSTLALSHNDGAAMEAGHRLGMLTCQGARNATGTMATGATMQCFADEDWTSGPNSSAGYWSILTAPSGGSATERIRIKSTGQMRFVPIAQPSVKEEGDCYFDSTSHKLTCWDGSAWQAAW